MWFGTMLDEGREPRMNADMKEKEDCGNEWRNNSLGSMGQEFKLQLAAGRQGEA